MKIHFISALLLALAVAGCATDREKIAFLSDDSLSKHIKNDLPPVAPPSVDLPSFEFEGGKAVETSSDAVQVYKGYLEYALRSKWNRPDNLADDNYVAEVDIAVNRAGDVGDPVWRKGSGDPKWDESVRKVFAAVSRLDHPPPTNFPPRVTIRFDVQGETEPVLQ